MRKQKTFQTVLTLLCGALCGVCSFMALSVSSLLSAKAETISENMECAGASIRVAEDEKSGMRFHVRIESDENGNVTLDGTDYTKAELNELITGIDITPDELPTKSIKRTGAWKLIEVDGSYFMETQAYVYDIEKAYSQGYTEEEYLDKQFTFRGWYKTTADSEKVYTNTQSRSLSTVAMLAKKDISDGSWSGLNALYNELEADNEKLKEVLNSYLPANRTAVGLPNVDKYLYRVGNGNTFSANSLFTLTETENVAISENITCPEGGSVSITKNNGTYQFSGTGIAELTLTEEYSRNTQTLTVEVVDGYNVTTYSELKDRNSVLLNDITMSSGGSYSLANSATLYGNGFTFDMTDGAYVAKGNVSSNYVFNLNNANIDNVKIIGAVYTKYGATVKDDYNRAAILSSGNSTIVNSYVSNCASAVRVKDGNLEIVNSTIKGGNFANIDIRGGHVVLDNVTTINQVNGNDTATDGTVVVGLGVVVYYENVLNTTTVEIENGITQYNHLSKTQVDSYIKDSTAKTLTSAMFDSAYSDLQYNGGNDTWVNTGILSMTESVGNDNISDVSGYEGYTVTLTNIDGFVCTKVPNADSIATTPATYESKEQGAIAPSYSFDYTSENYVAKTEGSNDYCYYDNGKVLVSMDEGETFTWDTSILSVSKNEKSLDYTVSMNKIDYTEKSISFSKAGDYEVVYTYTDSDNYNIQSGKVATYSKTYTKTVHINVAVVKAAAKNAVFTFGSANTASTTVTNGNTTYVMPNVSATSSTIGSKTVGGKTIYYPIVEIIMSDNKTTHTSAWYAYFPVFSNALSITDYADGGTGAEVKYGSSTQEMPSGLSIVGDPSTLFKYQSSSSAGASPVVKNNILVYSSPSISANRSEFSTVVEYTYQDNAGTTYNYYVGYHAVAQTYRSCVTPDTLVTLADGTQKEIQYVTYTDKLLVWDFTKGEYTTATSSIIMNHGYDYYNVVTLNFADGTIVKTINGHGFFDMTTNEFVVLSNNNAEDYIGHEFVKQDGTITKLVSYSVKQEYTESWSILTVEHYNCILEGMLTLTPAEVEGSPKYLMPFEIGEGMKYDEAQMQADIEKYGLYTYEDFAEYMTYEQFEALNLSIFKVSVGKGYITWEEILYLISIHIG